jgi:hypothetical protein
MSRARFSALFVLFAVAAGCNPPVSQDRKITVSPDGKQVAIQHDEEGVFLTDTKTGKPQKVFEPGSDVLATSSPRWEPAGKRVIFAVAKTPDGRPAPRVATPADGRRYTAIPCVYTCMLIEDSADKNAKPVELFTAPCDHVGYIGADLALRWHPDARHIDFVKRTEPGKHSLFRFDLATKETRRVLDADADSLVFEFLPNTERRYVLRGTRGGEGTDDGLWFEQPDGSWRHAPGTRVRPASGFDVLESLRESRPAFTRSGDKAALAQFTRAKEDDAGTTTVTAVPVSGGATQTWLTAPGRLRDFHWRPDGAKLALVHGGKVGELQLVGPDGSEPLAPGERVVSFAGWDSSGGLFAYVRQDDLPCQKHANSSLLLYPNADARSSVIVVAADGQRKELISGLQATFLNWFPNEAKLTLWLTFEPSYRRITTARSTGLMGDPAATLDAVTGKLDWKTVNGFENVQVGHHHLMRGELAEAAHVYEQARPHLTEGERRELLVFEWLLLKRQGRGDAARAKIEEYRWRSVPVCVAAEGQGSARPVPAGFVGGAPAAVLMARNFASILECDLFIAEAGLSIGATDEVAEFFRAALATEDGPARLSNSLILASLEMLRGRTGEYAELLLKWAVPLLPETPEKQKGDGPYVRAIATLVAQPIHYSEYLNGITAAMRKNLVARLRTARTEAKDEDTRKTLNGMLYCLAASLKDEQLRAECARNLGLDTPAKEQQFRDQAEGIYKFLRSGWGRS